MSLSDVPESMGWDEAGRLARILRNDPSSMIAAALEGWDYPISREALVAMDHFDLDAAVNSPRSHKPKPYPRPFKRKDRKRHGDTGGRSREEVEALLRDAARGALGQPVGGGG